MVEFQPTERQRRNYYFAIISVISMQITASTIYMVFPLFFASVGLNKAESGLLISIGTLAGVISSIAAGVLSNRYGRKNVLLIGTLLYTVVFFVFAYSPAHFGVLMALRFVEGIGFYIMPVMVTTMAADTFPPAERGRAMSLYSVSSGVGNLIGPLVSPFLITGNSYFTYFVFSGAFVGVSALVMILLVKETLSDSLKEKLKSASAGKKISISGFLKSVKGLGAVVGIFLVSVLLYRTGYTMIDPFFSLYLRDVLNINLSLTSYIFAVRALAMIAFAPLAGIFTDRWGRKNAVLLGLGLSVVTLIGYTYAFDFLPMLLLKGLDGVTWSVLLTAINTLMSDMLSPEMRGFGMGLQSAISQQSSTIGSVFSGFLIDAYGFNLVFYLAAGAAVLSLLVVLGFIPEPKRRKGLASPVPTPSH